MFETHRFINRAGSCIKAEPFVRQEINRKKISVDSFSEGEVNQ